MIEIITRAEWGARLPRCSTLEPDVTELFLHHSVGSTNQDKDADGDSGDDYMRIMQNFHMDSKGWCDIAYNHAHDPDGGEFYEGRLFGVRPGAQCGHNTGTHALVVMGDFRSRVVTTQLKADIAGFYVAAITEGLLPNVTVKGHRDAPISGSCSGTTCPGTNLYAALLEINQLIQEGLDMPLSDDDIQRIWRFPRVAGVDIQTALTRIHNATAGFDTDVDLIVTAIAELPADVVDAIRDRLG